MYQMSRFAIYKLQKLYSMYISGMTVGHWEYGIWVYPQRNYSMTTLSLSPIAIDLMPHSVLMPAHISSDCTPIAVDSNPPQIPSGPPFMLVMSRPPQILLPCLMAQPLLIFPCACQPKWFGTTICSVTSPGCPRPILMAIDLTPLLVLLPA